MLLRRSLLFLLALVVLALAVAPQEGVAAVAKRQTSAQKKAAAKRAAAKRAAALKACVATNRKAAKKTVAKKKPATARAAVTRTAVKKATAKKAATCPTTRRVTPKPVVKTPAASTAPTPVVAPVAEAASTKPVATTPACCAATTGAGSGAVTPVAPSSAGTPAAVSPATGLQVGLNVNVKAWGSDAGYILDKAAFIGNGWIREEIDWDDIEATQGTYTWTRYDQLFKAAATRGVQVLAMPMSPPSWAASAWNAYPDDVADYGRFVAKVVGRYGPSGTFWAANPSVPKVPLTAMELWNEPYEPFFSLGGLNPLKYTQLVKAGATAGRAVDPGVRYLLGATPYAKGLPQVWTAALYAAMPDLNSYFDAVAIHPYGPDLTAASGQWRRTFEDVRATLVAHGAADKPLWATEMGWSTCTANTQCVSEAKQAELMKSALDTIRRDYGSYVAAVFPYHFQDQFGNPSQANPEGFYGLVHADFTPKPAAGVLHDFIASLG